MKSEAKRGKGRFGESHQRRDHEDSKGERQILDFRNEKTS